MNINGGTFIGLSDSDYLISSTNKGQVTINGDVSFDISYAISVSDGILNIISGIITGSTLGLGSTFKTDSGTIVNIGITTDAIQPTIARLN